jgi:hypothetical protein
MKYLSLILLLMLASCGRKMLPPATVITKDSLVYKEVVKLKDTTIFTPGQNITIYQPVPCPDAVFDTSIRKGNLNTNVKLFKGVLSVNCNTDSLLQRIAWLEKDRYSLILKADSKSIPYPVEVIKYKIPKWIWWLILVLSANTLWQYRYNILSLIKP